MTKKEVPKTPLAERIRPKTVNEFEGQRALLGEGKPIRLMIENDNLSLFMVSNLL